MLSCKNLTVKVPNSEKPILENASVAFKPYAMNAVIGPSGCGKTTLLKAMLKIIDATGDSFFCGQKINSCNDIVGRVGFAPQFTQAQGKLTVRETILSTLDIALKDNSKKAERIEYILKITGLKAHENKLVESLSGGQLRRIGLGMELANNPPAMFCDEITTGLDPLSENAILDLLKDLCKNENKTFICIIHNLAKLDYFDLITVIYEGRAVFQGTLKELNEYFEIDTPLKLYDRLNEKPLEFWLNKQSLRGLCEFDAPEEIPQAVQKPSWAKQASVLLRRRISLFFRDTSYLLLTSAITFGFPLVVVIFALGGLPQIESLALDRNLGFIEELRANLALQIKAANVSTLVTGLILFQVVLLNLIASNNGAREIASERGLYEKERLLGLSPFAYCVSKFAFVSIIALFQSLWMCAFVKYACKFPGEFIEQAAILCAVGVSMTFVCLAFSALSNSPDKASLVSIYLVGFQLPLSGVVLALPDSLVWVCRPFINTYWGWSGYMSTMKDSKLYDAYVMTQSNFNELPSIWLVLLVLAIHSVLAMAAVYYGCQKRRHG